MRSSTVLIAAVGWLAGGCVTTYEDAPLNDSGGLDHPEFAVTQTIPFGDPDASPEERLLQRFYGGVFARMQTALEEQDHETLFLLAGRYDKAGQPVGVRERLAGYRALAHGLVFLEHASDRASLLPIVANEPVAPAGQPAQLPPIGESLKFEFALPAGPEAVGIGGDDPIGFAITMSIDDDFVDGGRSGQTKTSVQWVREACELTGDEVLRLPVELELAAGAAVRRTIHLRVDLMPGHVRVGGERAPVQQRRIDRATSLPWPAGYEPLVEGTWTQWPAGYEPIRERPLDTLREALRLGDARHFPHVYLGASFSQGTEREAAIALLVDQVRLGKAAQAKVAMAALAAITEAEIPVGDRERWLAWFDLR